MLPNDIFIIRDGARPSYFGQQIFRWLYLIAQLVVTHEKAAAKSVVLI